MPTFLCRCYHFYADEDDVAPTLCVDFNISMLMMMMLSQHSMLMMMMLFQHLYADDADGDLAFIC